MLSKPIDQMTDAEVKAAFGRVCQTASYGAELLEELAGYENHDWNGRALFMRTALKTEQREARAFDQWQTEITGS